MAITIAPPVNPHLPKELNVWSGKPAAELELVESRIADSQFSKVLRLEIEKCVLEKVSMADARLVKLAISDSRLQSSDAVGVQAFRADFLRVHVKDCRFTGADCGEGRFKDCVFSNVKLDEVGLRSAHLERVRFEHCVLRRSDFTGANLVQVSFDNCEFEGVIFDKMTCKAVDLRGENLRSIKGVQGLKGATISSEQLVQLAPLLAAELGINVDI